MAQPPEQVAATLQTRYRKATGVVIRRAIPHGTAAAAGAFLFADSVDCRAMDRIRVEVPPGNTRGPATVDIDRIRMPHVPISGKGRPDLSERHIGTLYPGCLR